jgi:hypothetical protein
VSTKDQEFGYLGILLKANVLATYDWAWAACCFVPSARLQPVNLSARSRRIESSNIRGDPCRHEQHNCGPRLSGWPIVNSGFWECAK